MKLTGTKPPRDPARIPEILKALEVYWTQNPHLRLGQVVFALNDGRDPFYMEDDVLLTALRKKTPDAT